MVKCDFRSHSGSHQSSAWIQNSSWSRVWQLVKELRSLKSEHEECLEALKKETHDKAKAETTATVLKSIIESQEKIKEVKKMENGSESEMDIDDGMGKWIQQQKRKSLKFQKRKIQGYKCETCGDNLQDEENLKSHEENHRNKNTYCYKCDEIFVEKGDYVKHQEKHREKITYKCDVCGKIFGTSSELHSHVKSTTQ